MKPSNSSDGWRLERQGDDNLGCILNGHLMCDSECDICFPTNSRGHCYNCNLGTLYSADTKLPLIKVYPIRQL